MNKRIIFLRGGAGKSLAASLLLVFFALMPGMAWAGESENPDEVLLDSATALRYTKDGVVLGIDGKAAISIFLIDPVIPASINGTPIVQIGDGEHSILTENSIIRSVSIADDAAVTIKKNAFANSELVKVEIGAGVTAIEPYAFSHLNVKRAFVFKQEHPQAYVDGKGYSPEMFGANLDKIMEIQVPSLESEQLYGSLITPAFSYFYLAGSELANGSLRDEGVTYKLDNSAKTATVLRANAGYHYEALWIPSKVEANGEKYTVTAIEPGAFAGVKVNNLIGIPGTVTTVGSNAFDGLVFDYNPLYDLRIFFDYGGTDFSGFAKDMFGVNSLGLSVIVPEGRGDDFKAYFQSEGYVLNFVEIVKKNVDLTSEQGFPQTGFYECSLTYTYQLTEQEKNGYVNVMLPFRLFTNEEPFLSEVEAVYSFSKMTKKDNGEYDIDFEQVPTSADKSYSTIPTHQPLLMKVKDGVSELHFSYEPVPSPYVFVSSDGITRVAPVLNEVGDTLANDAAAFVAQYVRNDKGVAGSGTYQLAADGSVSVCQQGSALELFRAYPVLVSGGEELTGAIIKTNLQPGGGTTGIGDSIITNKPAQQKAAIYGIDGKLVRAAGSGMQGLSKGIYVQGGKKIIVR